MSKINHIFVSCLFVFSFEFLVCSSVHTSSEYTLKVKVAHVLNPRELTGGNGEVKPEIQFVGPFVYYVRIIKSVVRQNSNETLTFTYKKSYEFLSEVSVANEDDAYFLVPSVPYLKFVNSNEDPKVIQEILEANSEIQPFVLVTVKELLWGYEDPVLKALHAKNLSNNTKFGIFLGDEEMRDQTLTVSTGSISTDGLVGDEYATVEFINGGTTLPFWEGNSSCTQIRGTDLMDPSVRVVPNKTGSGYESVYFLNSHACRPLQFSFKQEETDESGHEILRFELDQNILNTDSQDNKCYCRNSTNCPSKGTLDLYKCKPGVTLSWPNFASADPSILSKHDVSLSQRSNTDKNILEVMKTSGIVDRLSLSLQYNTWMKSVKDVPATTKFPNVLLPIVQITDSIEPDEIDDEDGDTNTLDTPEAAELKKEAKKVVKHVVNQKLNKKNKKHKGAAGSLTVQSFLMGSIIVIFAAIAHF